MTSCVPFPKKTRLLCLAKFVKIFLYFSNRTEFRRTSSSRANPYTGEFRFRFCVCENGSWFVKRSTVVFTDKFTIITVREQTRKQTNDRGNNITVLLFRPTRKLRKINIIVNQIKQNGSFEFARSVSFIDHVVWSTRDRFYKSFENAILYEIKPIVIVS